MMSQYRMGIGSGCFMPDFSVSLEPRPSQITDSYIQTS